MRSGPPDRVMSEAYPYIEIITLCYNNKKYLQGYFDAIEKLDYPKDKISLNILDNGSGDDTYAHLIEVSEKRSQSPMTVRTFRSSRNLGFAGGNNHLFWKLTRLSRAPFFMLLNLDTEIDPKCLKHLVASMQKDNHIGIVEARQQPREHPKWYDPKTLETGWCSCGGALIRRKALEAIGYFDEKFFLYCEDVDLSWRMWLTGWRCIFNPKAVYTHYTETLDQDKDMSLQIYFSLRNSFFLHFKYDSWKGIFRHRRQVNDMVRKETDPQVRKLYKKARRKYKKYIPHLLMQRWTTGHVQGSEWIVFNGMDYERRREFQDTPAGRIILNKAS